MQCIYDKTIPCEINPDGPINKDFRCLECNKPENKIGDSKDESIEKGKRNAPRNKVSGKGGGRGRKVNMYKKKVRGRRGKKQQGNRKRI